MAKANLVERRPEISFGSDGSGEEQPPHAAEGTQGLPVNAMFLTLSTTLEYQVLGKVQVLALVK